MKQSRAALLLTAVLLVQLCGALDNGLSLKPILGYNTWNAFGGNIDEQTMRQIADKMVELGLTDIGYTYFNLDDAWSETSRNPDGILEGNKQRFPSGIKSIADYVHSKGMKFGIYSDSGQFTCMGFPGSRNHEETDAKHWASWGVDYVKYDNCFADNDDDVILRYKSMRDALNATGRPMVFSLCEWGVQAPWLWASDVGNSWRTTDDNFPTWERILENLEGTVGLSRFAGQGGWNDPDLLEVGNGQLSVGEQRAHFALWALLKSPLIISADLRSIAPASLAILKAREVIAINQDELGIPGDRIWKQGLREIYAGPLSGGARAVVMLNRHHAQYRPTMITVHWREIGLPDDAPALVRDLYEEKDLGVYTGSFTASVQLHDVRVLKVVPLRALEEYDEWRAFHQQPIYAIHEEDYLYTGSGSAKDSSSGSSSGGGDASVYSGGHNEVASTDDAVSVS